ncbi:dephospho-CoA kinase [Bombilactobacillus folatiphilus]|uniref:Dephospho-CoA kinase n=1 Tax=Bombilactobacillus folatiphilus TaxID=2923362 RepID=A0ABY4PBL2_9LACO|nr:dephospho-CoA kinase [Bombilactobacillus folatiphilus]UQS82647.1 dephospho-CoA kinase [Bombilactobacillus folatiphilus]
MGQVIGITGGIASGKTTVGELIRAAGFLVIDADQVAQELIASPSIVHELAERFGSRILNRDGSLNRAQLSQIVFGHASKLQILNELTQPVIRQQLLAQMDAARAGESKVFFEIPLLFEQHYERLVDQIVVVSVPEQQQLTRLMQRNGFTKAQARVRINSQLPIAQKCQRADFVLDNTQGPHELAQQVQALLTQI